MPADFFSVARWEEMVNKLKAITRKAEKKPAAPPPKAETTEEKKKMSDEIDDLTRQVEELTQENSELKAKVEELERNNAAINALPGPGQTKEWTRGKLPGDKLIKTSTKTGEFEEIDQQEWDSLA